MPTVTTDRAGSQEQLLTVIAPPPLGATGSGGSIGYSVLVTLFGTGATYNPDGTVSGAPNGAAYTYNPDMPDAHTTMTNLGDFVSDFAGFTQGNVQCVRDDTDLRVQFRKDKSPDPTRIEIVLWLGHYRTGGTAANLGPFALQIFRAGVPQNIPVYTVSGGGSTWVPGGATFTGFTNVTTAYFPQMGYWSRWRWNPTPRAFVRTGAQLLPANLNLLPNYSQSFGATYGAVAGGVSTGATPTLTAYSSAFNSGPTVSITPTNFNPVGINENCTVATSFGGTGDRPELGIAHESAIDWVLNGTAAMRTTMLVVSDVSSGIGWHFSDGTVTNWGPHDFNAHPQYAWIGGAAAPPYVNIDAPLIHVPSNGLAWDLGDLNHVSVFSYVPYVVTGDPYYLEELQYKLAHLIGHNSYHRQSGFIYNFPDANNPLSTAPFDQMLPFDGVQSRSRGWAIRDIAQAYLASPTTVPQWLQPKSYFKSINDANQSYTDTWRANANANYPEFAVLGNVIIGDADYGLYLWYENMGLGFAISQGGLTNWLPFANYRSAASIATTAGVSGWDNRWTHEYGYFNVFFSTDYGIPTAKPTSFGDIWTYQVNNAMYDANTQYAIEWSTNIAENGCGPLFPAWQPSTAYHCNSWLIEFRGGVPVVPNVNDAVSFTISGSFSGSPVTIQHTVIAPDQNALVSICSNNNTISSPDATPPAHLIVRDLMGQINQNPSLIAAGITAVQQPTTGPGVVGTSYRPTALAGRFYVTFNSDGSFAGGGPVVGPITVTGTYTPFGTPTSCSIYIQPNGDPVRNGTSTSAVLYHRYLSYQCAQSGTSGTAGGPTGTALQTPTIVDGTCRWCYVPEMKSCPTMVPGSLLTSGRASFGGPYGYVLNNPDYAYWAMCGLAQIADAGITDAAHALSGRNAIKVYLDDFMAGNGGASLNPQGWRWAIVP